MPPAHAMLALPSHCEQQAKARPRHTHRTKLSTSVWQAGCPAPPVDCAAPAPGALPPSCWNSGCSSCCWEAGPGGLPRAEAAAGVGAGAGALEGAGEGLAGVPEGAGDAKEAACAWEVPLPPPVQAQRLQDWAQ